MSALPHAPARCHCAAVPPPRARVVEPLVLVRVARRPPCDVPANQNKQPSTNQIAERGSRERAGARCIQTCRAAPPAPRVRCQCGAHVIARREKTASWRPTPLADAAQTWPYAPARHVDDWRAGCRVRVGPAKDEKQLLYAGWRPPPVNCRAVGSSRRAAAAAGSLSPSTPVLRQLVPTRGARARARPMTVCRTGLGPSRTGAQQISGAVGVGVGVGVGAVSSLDRTLVACGRGVT